MESTLHQQLKVRYAGRGQRTEVRLDGFRIDAMTGGKLIEIQFSSLGAIRDKIRRLLQRRKVLVVKPIVVRKCIVKLARKGGQEVSRRMSPKRCGPLALFDELVYFTDVFPHRNLTLEAPLIEIEELRFPKRRRRADFSVEDRRLVKIVGVVKLKTLDDLWRLADASAIDQPFNTEQLAKHLQVPRWQAQRIAYCWRRTGAVEQVGKQGNALLYRRAAA